MAAARCRFCAAELSESFVDLGMSPLANSYIDQHQLLEMERFFPLHVYVCSGCLLVQLMPVVSPESIFREYAYFSSYSGGLVENAKIYAGEITDRLGLDSDSQVIEIASNDGYLLQYFRERGVPVLGIEPASNVAVVAREKQIPTVEKFFGAATARELVQEGRRADLLVANNVLAHVPDLNDFVGGMKILLAPVGVITVEFPHLVRLMQENQFDTIYHEHLSYFSFRVVCEIFAAHELKVFDVEEVSNHGGSLRVFARHDDGNSGPISERVQACLEREEALGFGKLDHYLSFETQVAATKRKLLRLLLDTKGKGESVVGYGAAAKGNTLLNYCGIRTDILDYVVDRSPHKQNLWLPGTHIPVVSPDRLRETKPDHVLILAWNLKAEVMKEIAFISEWGGRFMVPIPEPEAIG